MTLYQPSICLILDMYHLLFHHTNKEIQIQRNIYTKNTTPTYRGTKKNKTTYIRNNIKVKKYRNVKNATYIQK